LCYEWPYEAMEKERQLALVEAAGSVAWFAMDASWMLSVRSLAVTLALPTVLLNVLVFPFIVRSWANWLVAGAMVAWSCMNVLWMVYDLQLLAWGLSGGKVFLVLGALMLAAAGFVNRSAALTLVAARFRRLRVRA
jgi:hypothetical protein